ncbi:hypothetical protein MRX96_002595 [Rhipicephalus microplus]
MCIKGEPIAGSSKRGGIKYGEATGALRRNLRLSASHDVPAPAVTSPPRSPPRNAGRTRQKVRQRSSACCIGFPHAHSPIDVPAIVYCARPSNKPALSRWMVSL